MRERRLREAAENIQRKSASAPHESANIQKESSLQRISRQISAHSSRPCSQYGDAESPPEWYQHEEGNHTQVYEPKDSAGIFDNIREIGSDIAEESEGGNNGGIPTAASPHFTQRSNSQVQVNNGKVKMQDNTGKSTSPAVLKLQQEIEKERAFRKKELEEARALTNDLRVALQQVQAELEEEKALQCLRSHDPQPTPQVITVKTEDEIDPNKLMLPILNAKSEPELEQWLVRARTGIQSAARDSGLPFFAKAEAVGKMYVEDWRDSAAHHRGGILLRDPGYTQKEREVEKKIGASIIAKLPVAAQDFAQKDAESNGGVLELHVALSKAFLLIMATTADEKDAIVDKLREKQNVPAGKLLQFMKQYRLDYERLVNCGFIREADDHNKYYKALQHTAMNPGRSPSFVTAEVMYKRDNPPPTFFMSKKYFDGYLEFLTKELYGHREYGESRGNFVGGGDHMFGATAIQ